MESKRNDCKVVFSDEFLAFVDVVLASTPVCECTAPPDAGSETIVYLKIEGFHCAALASITDEQPVSTRYFSMSSYPFTNVETPLAITGIETAWATSRITSI